jgi:hypothetical protein
MPAIPTSDPSLLIGERPAHDDIDYVVRQLMFISQMPPDARFDEAALAIFQTGNGGGGCEYQLAARALQIEHVRGFE